VDIEKSQHEKGTPPPNYTPPAREQVARPGSEEGASTILIKATSRDRQKIKKEANVAKKFAHQPHL